MKNILMKQVGASLALLWSLSIYAQESKSPYQQYLIDCKSGKGVDVPKEVLEDAKSAKHWLSSFESPLLGNGKGQICAIDGIFDILRANPNNKNLGRVGVNLLTQKLRQGTFNDYILDRMERIPESFYLETHKETIYSLAQNNATPHRNKMIPLLATLRYEPALGLIRTMLEDPKTQKITKFKYHAFLARLGEEESIKWMKEEIGERKLNDESVDVIVPLLLSTKRKELVQWVVNGLYETEALCYSNDPGESKKIQCGYRILEYLAPAIKDFPIKADEFGLIDSDYVKALETARTWFKENPNYSIR